MDFFMEKKNIEMHVDYNYFHGFTIHKRFLSLHIDM